MTATSGNAGPEAGPAAGPGLGLVLGEIRTCLLQNSVPVAPDTAAHLLTLRPGERARSSERPNNHVASPPRLTGVDCPLPTRTGSRVRAVGTACAHALLTEGRVLQSSVRVQAVPAADPGRRLPWGHYLARPGVVEALGRLVPQDVADGFLADRQAPGAALDLGALAERLLAEVGRRAPLDRRPPFKSRRTRLRWTVEPTTGPGQQPTATFTIENEALRTVRLRTDRIDPDAAVRLCEDLALHDWLLTALGQAIERSGLDSGAGLEAVTRLRPVVDHLLHVWMPGVRVAPELSGVWESLERRPGFSRQWRALEQRVRDQLAVQTVALLSAMHAEAQAGTRTRMP